MLLTKNNYRLATGFVAGVSIFPSGKESFVMIPVGSIVDADGHTGYAYTVTDSMTVQKIKVEIVTIYGTKVAIRGNLNGIKQIVSEGAAYLRDGERVKVVE
jgi:hypothetical protein